MKISTIPARDFIERNAGETRYQYQGRVARIKHERRAAKRAAAAV
jgi:hypothetical protein